MYLLTSHIASHGITTELKHESHYTQITLNLPEHTE